jgi:hypothetical protein
MFSRYQAAPFENLYDAIAAVIAARG